MTENLDALPTMPEDTEMPSFESAGDALSSDPSAIRPMKADTEPEPAPEPEQKAEPEPRGIRDMQRRIARLFAQKRSAEEAAQSERQRAAALEARLRELEARLAVPFTPPVPSAAPAPAPAVDGVYNPYLAAPAPAAPPTGVDPRVLTAALQGAIAPIVERLEARERLEALVDAHERSWDAAREEFPELDVSGSTLRKVAESVLRQDEALARDPNGPYKAVLLARGLLADARPSVGDQVRRQAGPAAAGVPGDGRSLAALQEEYRKLLAQGIFDGRGWTRAQQLRRQIAALRNQK